MTTLRLFVYGTLAPGRANQHILEPIGGTWEKGTVTGTLHAEGWGAEMGYPGIILGPDGDLVEGHVLSCDKLSESWAMLDEFEGDGYERVRTNVRLSDGREVSAYIYVLKRT